jgi:hypothetical protein
MLAERFVSAVAYYFSAGASYWVHTHWFCHRFSPFVRVVLIFLVTLSLSPLTHRVFSLPLNNQDCLFALFFLAFKFLGTLFVIMLVIVPLTSHTINDVAIHKWFLANNTPIQVFVARITDYSVFPCSRERHCFTFFKLRFLRMMLHREQITLPI